MRPDVEPTEVTALLGSLVDPQQPGDDDMAQLTYLTGRINLLDAAADQLRQQRADTALRLYTSGATSRALGAHTGVNHNAVEGWLKTARSRAS